MANQNIEMKHLNGSGTYDTLYPKTLSTNTIISNATATEMGLSSGATVDQALSTLQSNYKKRELQLIFNQSYKVTSAYTYNGSFDQIGVGGEVYNAIKDYDIITLSVETSEGTCIARANGSDTPAILYAGYFGPKNYYSSDVGNNSYALVSTDVLATQTNGHSGGSYYDTSIIAGKGVSDMILIRGNNKNDSQAFFYSIKGLASTSTNLYYLWCDNNKLYGQGITAKYSDTSFQQVAFTYTLKIYGLKLF